MWVVQGAIKRPILVAMFFLAFVVLGWQSYRRLVLELFPNIDFPFLTVTVVYPGADPEEVETVVTRPIEEVLSTLSGVRHIYARSGPGISVVMLEFELGVNIDAAAEDVRSRIGAIRGELPPDIEEPVISKFDIGAFPVISLAVTGDRPMWQVRKIAGDVIAPRLSRIPGVARVVVAGGKEREIQVNVFADRLAAYQLTLTDILQALKRASVDVPAGAIEQGDREWLIRAVGRFTDMAQIRDTIVRFGDRRMGFLSAPIRVGDVAEVVDGVADPQLLTRLNGRESVGIAIFRRADANTVDVAERVKTALKDLKTSLPKDIRIVIALDQSVFIRNALDDIRQALFLGVLLAILVVLLFLRDWRGTIIVGLAIPTSIIASFLIIRFMGYSLNFMVMLGLALVVGTLVDGAIVVLENIYRHLESGEHPKEAAENAMGELGAAIAATVMTNLIVFVPLIFLGGIIGRFFRPFAVTVVAATVFSLFVAFTLTPMLSAHLFRAPSPQKGDRFRGFESSWDRFVAGYESLLRWALSNRALVLVGGNLILMSVLSFMMPLKVRLFIAILTGALGALGAIFVRGQRKGFLITAAFLSLLPLLVHIPTRFGFLPRTDRGMVHLILEFPSHYSLRRTDTSVRKVEEFLSRRPEVEAYITSVGTTGAGMMEFGATGSQFANIFIKLVDKTERSISDKEFGDILSRWVWRNIPDAVAVEVQEQHGLARSGALVQLEILGQDRKTLVGVARRIAERLRHIPDVRDIKISWRPGRPEIQVRVNREKAADLGFSVGEIGLTARIAFEGDTSLRFREDGDEYPIRVRLSPRDRRSPEDVAYLFIGTGLKDEPVRLGEVAEIVWGKAPVTLERKDRQEMILVTANLAPWASLGNVQNKIEAALQGMELVGTRIHFGGWFESMRENMAELGGAMRLSIVLLYMLMAGLFNSVALPLSIMLTVPQALVGAFLLLMLTGKEWGITSGVGIIMVLGLVVNAAIILVDYTQILRGRGMDRLEAVILAGKTRLRPVLMTVLTTTLAVIPTALEWGRGAELRSPMAIAVIGGLLLSTLLTLLVVPVAYTVVDDLVTRSWRWWRSFR